jgi:hypothetical protein
MAAATALACIALAAWGAAPAAAREQTATNPYDHAGGGAVFTPGAFEPGTAFGAGFADRRDSPSGDHHLYARAQGYCADQLFCDSVFGTRQAHASLFEYDFAVGPSGTARISVRARVVSAAVRRGTAETFPNDEPVLRLGIGASQGTVWSDCAPLDLTAARAGDVHVMRCALDGLTRTSSRTERLQAWVSLEAKAHDASAFGEGDSVQAAIDVQEIVVES